MKLDYEVVHRGSQGSAVRLQVRDRALGLASRIVELKPDAEETEILETVNTLQDEVIASYRAGALNGVYR